MAPFLFAFNSHPLIIAPEDSASKELIQGLALPNGQHMLGKMFVDDSLVFLKADREVVRNALEVVQLFAEASGSKCNIEKSKMISLAEEDSFHSNAWLGDVIPRGKNFRNLGAPLGVRTTFKHAFSAGFRVRVLGMKTTHTKRNLGSTTRRCDIH